MKKNSISESPRIAPADGMSRPIGAVTEEHPIALRGGETLAALKEGFKSAAARCPEELCEFSCSIAGQPIRFKVVGKTLAAALARPLSHLPSLPVNTSEKGLLEMQVWSESETGVCRPHSADPGLGPFGLIMKAPASAIYGHERPSSSCWLDVDAGCGVGCFASVARMNLDELAKPFNRLLSIWLRKWKILLIHAALVAKEGAGILIAGMGGTGKSTCSAACLIGGFAFLGDDFVAIRRSGSRFLGASIFSTVMLNAEHSRRLSDLAVPMISPKYAYEEKSMACLADRYGERLPAQISLSCVVLPRLALTENTNFTPAPRISILSPLAASSLLMMPAPRREDFETLAELVQSLPCYWLNVGREPATIPAALKRLTEELPLHG